jgi:hypothetical protein
VIIALNKSIAPIPIKWPASPIKPLHWGFVSESQRRQNIMNRVTKKELQALCDWINELMGTPQKPYEKVNGKYEPQAKCYHLSGAYGGYALHRMADSGSGVHDIFHGHMPKRELADKMRAFIRGAIEAKEASKND